MSGKSTLPSSVSVSAPNSSPSISGIPTPTCTPSASATQKKLDAIGDAFGIEKRYTDYDELLKDPNVDAVHINSPIPDHAWQSIAALKAGKHVACTVPMATSIEDCRKIVDLVKKTGLKYMMMETVVYAREYLFMKELLRHGRARQNAVPPGEPSAGHGRLAELLARPAADVVCDALRRPGLRD